jgi:oxygen-independent coproporphyrinogen-3 oxidase
MQAFYLARELGFDNINMDLIIGLPGEGPDEVRHTMEVLEKMDPDSITVHSLALKRATRLNLMKDVYREISFTNSAQIMDMSAESCERSGLRPYHLYRQKNMAGNFENVGYAKEGKACLYNILIMEEVQSILALGASGSTKIVEPDGRIWRIENVKDIRSYLERIDEMIARKDPLRTE